MGPVADARLDLPHGTLDLLILETLSHDPMAGWAGAFDNKTGGPRAL